MSCRQFVNTPEVKLGHTRAAAFVHTDVMKGPTNKLVQNRTEIRARKAKRGKFARLVERFRNATDTKEAKRLGDKLGAMIFGN
jgi:hypothetical protein